MLKSYMAIGFPRSYLHVSISYVKSIPNVQSNPIVQLTHNLAQKACKVIPIAVQSTPLDL